MSVPWLTLIDAGVTVVVLALALRWVIARLDHTTERLEALEDRMIERTEDER